MPMTDTVPLRAPTLTSSVGTLTNQDQFNITFDFNERVLGFGNEDVLLEDPVGEVVRGNCFLIHRAS